MSWWLDPNYSGFQVALWLLGIGFDRFCWLKWVAEQSLGAQGLAINEQDGRDKLYTV